MWQPTFCSAALSEWIQSPSRRSLCTPELSSCLPRLETALRHQLGDRSRAHGSSKLPSSSSPAAAWSDGEDGNMHVLYRYLELVTYDSRLITRTFRLGNEEPQLSSLQLMEKSRYWLRTATHPQCRQYFQNSVSRATSNTEGTQSKSLRCSLLIELLTQEKLA